VTGCGEVISERGPPGSDGLVSTPFLYRFSVIVVRRLLQGDRLEVVQGREEQVVRHVADALTQAREGSSLVSTLTRALLASPDVEELFADEDELRELINDLGSGP
jgi:hypothetical protein